MGMCASCHPSLHPWVKTEDGISGSLHWVQGGAEQGPGEADSMTLEQHLSSSDGSIKSSGICGPGTGSSHFIRLNPGTES